MNVLRETLQAIRAVGDYLFGFYPLEERVRQLHCDLRARYAHI